MANTLLIIIIAIILLDYFLERFLEYLNSKSWSTELPVELEGIYDVEKYTKAQKYDRAKQKFSIITDTFGTILMIGMLVSGGFAWVDSIARSFSSNAILVSLIFFVILGFAADLLNTPFSIYSTFVIEERFGFNKTTIQTFILDKLKGWLLAAIVGGIIISLIVWFYISTGNMFWFYTWLLITGFSLFTLLFYSNLIVPLFNKQTPLPEGELRDAISLYANTNGFKLKNIYVIDGSKRSSKANAYFTGIGKKKRIVLYDTLIKDHSIDELVGILAHEVGHYKLKHTLLSFILGIVETGLMLFVFGLFAKTPVLTEALGASTQGFHLALLAFGILYSPISTILGIFTNMLSRKNEFQADAFAAKTANAEQLGLALKKLSVNNLSNLKPHPLYVFFYYSHPPLLQRLKALARVKTSN